MKNMMIVMMVAVLRVGNTYLTCFRDKNGEFLLGDRTYKLRIPAKVPIKRFWSVTAYDPVSRSLLDSGGQITVTSLRDHKVNPDGSVDVFFGPAKPEGAAK